MSGPEPRSLWSETPSPPRIPYHVSSSDPPDCPGRESIPLHPPRSPRSRPSADPARGPVDDLRHARHQEHHVQRAVQELQHVYARLLVQRVEVLQRYADQEVTPHPHPSPDRGRVLSEGGGLDHGVLR